ncbi:MAG: hypothetical protein M1832_000258 [Thelocarpon impressellum]|nr:MAG: hypothetical protein M1832_000258 [Thelocarpon impressellum]
MSSPTPDPQAAWDLDEAEYASSKPSKFRFKSKRRHRDDHDADLDRSHRSKRSRTSSPPSHPRRHRHRRSRRATRSPPPSAPDDPTLYDSTYLPNTRSANYVDPDTAFRESLFDALADDEGAAFWEGVYGQPIHTFPDVRPGPDGELERMSDEEYTAFVRARMYEKTHQHVMEERERREEARRKGKARAEAEEASRHNEVFDQEVEESLRRGQERRRRARWKKRWDEYVDAWQAMRDVAPDRENEYLSSDEVERFFKTATATPIDLRSVLKSERVRWHPDKLQQRLGGREGGVDESTMKAVTAVFQMVDRMWIEERGEAG